MVRKVYIAIFLPLFIVHHLLSSGSGPEQLPSQGSRWTLLPHNRSSGSAQRMYYKYNGTYLSQYIEDFIEFYRKINEKNKKYIEISMALVNLKYDFELLIDQSFAAIKSSQGLRYEYIGLNRKKIITPGVDIRLVIKCDENEFIFSKQYKDMKDTKYAEIIWEDVKQYTDVKEKKEANNET